MRIPKVLLSFFLIFLVNFSSAQSIGDTVVVQAFNYQSTTRDTVTAFPNFGTYTYEKVIMRYAMRCKNGLISPPVAGQTNLGCGEWDYSCNTYITDSTKADSSNASINRYAIFPDTNTSQLYSRVPTWEGRPLLQQAVQLQSIINEDTSSIGQGSILDSNIVNSRNFGGKTYLLIDSAELASANLRNGNINGLSFNNLGGTSSLLNFKVKIKGTSLSNLSVPDSTDFRGLQEVYYHNFDVVNGINRVQFHSPFSWNGSSNLLVELSYKAASGNNKLDIECHTTTGIQTLASYDDISLGLFSGNYVEADAYQGISGNGQRTVEAWIKTNVAGKDIVSWGTNSSGRKFIVRLDGSGKLRVEVNGGSYIGTKVLNDDKWHHIAVTFNGSSMYHFRFVVDGVWDRPTAIANTTVNTAQSRNVTVSGGFHNRYWEGNIDNVRIWSTNLPDAVIADWRYRKLSSSHPNYSSLELAYSFDNQSTTIIDESTNARNGEFKSLQRYNPLIGEEHFKNFASYTIRPNIELYQGSYNMTVSTDTLIDTTHYTPYSVIERTIYPKPGTVFSDSIGAVNAAYWPANNRILDINGNTSSTSISNDTISLVNNSLAYLNRNAIKLEIMSFVTPYGINLDLGIDGKAWYFDVSDFIPILSGPRRITLERGGQWQEEMDIQFLFIIGTPPRDVKSIEQIWPVSHRSYTQIINNTYFAPKTLSLDTTGSAYKIRSAITGHGQQGEFIPRTHYININGGPIDFSRLVWKECAENPIFPQGGTWIYDRAGWCPGMPTDLAEYDITSLIGGASTVNIDYGVNSASGDSRYIVNNQLVTYGAPNFSLDARITEVISPTNHAEFEKNNPVCDDVEIRIQNSGSTQLSSLQVEYWINNGTRDTYTWNGSLSFLEDTTIVLPTSSTFWTQLNPTGNMFHARITATNGGSDMYASNDSISRPFGVAEMLPSNFYLQFSSNNAASESSYDVRDASGTILFQRTSLNNNTTYRDTFNLSLGCYTLNVYDSDDDGLDFFANNDGIGSIRINNIGASNLKTFEPDFGDGFSYNFTISTPVGIEEQDFGESLTIYPNPVNSTLFIETTGLSNSNWQVYDSQGRIMKEGRSAGQHFNRLELDVSNFSEGIYFIRFGIDDSIVAKSFIVTN